MTHPKLRTLFIAGTDTDVGKTYTSALIVRRLRGLGRRVGVYKPVASGCRLSEGQWMAEDARLLWEAAGRPRTLEEVCPQRFGEPLAPPQAAAAEGARVDVERLREGAACWQQGFEVLVVEGAGGLFSPLADGVLNVDLARQLDATLIVVAANRLGAIHQAVATCAAAARHGLVPYGVILCNPSGRADGSRVGNAAQIARYCESPVLATVPFGGDERHVSFVEQWLGPPD